MLQDMQPSESRVLSPESSVGPESWREAVEIFDGANLAWGQFYRHTLAGRPEAEWAQAVREALGDAALNVPRAGSREEVQAFLAALRLAREHLRAFIEALPPDLASDPVRDMPDALLEAIELLKPYAA